MGAKASTPATSGHQSPRSRTYSSSSTGADTSPPQSAGLSGISVGVGIGGPDADTATSAAQGFNLLRTLPGLQVQHHHHHHHVHSTSMSMGTGSTSSNASSSIDRQRARSLSSVPDMQQQNSNNNGSNGGPHTHPAVSTVSSSNNFVAVTNINGSPNHSNYIQPRNTLGEAGIRDVSLSSGANFVETIALATSASAGANGGIGRVYTATSLPSHIWSFNGIKCPVCNKFVLPDDIECHLVMCLTKPRLSYNEDVLSDAKGECVICLEDLNPGDIIARLPCLCIYHKGCIDRWFEINRCCPEHPGD